MAPYSGNYDDLHQVFDYLYVMAEQYINKELRKNAVKIRLDYLKNDNKISSFEKAIDVAYKWHKDLYEKRKIEEEKAQLTKDINEVLTFDDGFKICQLLSHTALYDEGDAMGHCVGACGKYAAGIQEGTTQIYSLRDENFVPHVTFEVCKNKVLLQAKGQVNTKPLKYSKYCAEFLNKFKLIDESFDLKCVVKFNEKTGCYEEVQNLIEAKSANQILINNMQNQR